MIVRISQIASNICWWRDIVGQVSQVLEVSEYGYMKVRVMMPYLEYDQCIEKPPERHYQVEGWMPPDFVEVIHE